MQNIRDILDKNGWIEVEDIHTDTELISLSKKLGTVVEHPNGEIISFLTPKEKHNAVKGTLSNKFGFGNFPLHTDTAFWSTPIRYLVLNSVQPSNSNTHIVHFDKIWEQLSEKNKSNARKAIYLIKTIHGQHYSSLIFRNKGVEGFRFDPCTMFPFNGSAKEIHASIQEIISHLSVNEVKWTGQKALVIDNWKTLHGRSIINESEQRIIKRIYINQ